MGAKPHGKGWEEHLELDSVPGETLCPQTAGLPHGRTLEICFCCVSSSFCLFGSVVVNFSGHSQQVYYSFGAFIHKDVWGLPA